METDKASENLAEIARNYLEIATEDMTYRDVSTELNAIEALVRDSALSPEDIGTTGIELRVMRLEGVLANGLSVMRLAFADGNVSDDGIRTLFIDMMHTFGHAQRLQRLIPPELPLSDLEAVQKLMEESPFLQAAASEPRLVSFLDDGAIILEDEEGQFIDVTGVDGVVADGAPISAAVEVAEQKPASIIPRSFREERQIVSFFADRAEAFDFGFFPADLADIDSLEPTVTIVSVSEELTDELEYLDDVQPELVFNLTRPATMRPMAPAF